MNTFHQLPTADLQRLAVGLRSGRLAAPYRAAVHRFSATNAATIAEELETYSTAGWTTSQLASVLEAIATARQPIIESAFDLVWSGPDVQGLHNRDTGVVVRELFGSAHKEVLVAGFAVHQGRAIFARLAERMTEHPNLRVRFFLDVRRDWNHPTPTPTILTQFANHFRTHEWPGSVLPELYYDRRSLAEQATERSSLHAKCVVVDRAVSLVTSANFTEAAQVRNIEVGVLVRSEDFANQLHTHFEKLLATDVLGKLES